MSDLPPKRLSSDTESPLFHPIAFNQKLQILLNGQRQKLCTEYDQPAGWIDRIAVNDDDKPRLNDVKDAYVIERVYGVVSVELRD